MVKILQLIFGIGKIEALIIVWPHRLTSAISTLSGLWGVLVTDMVQFVIRWEWSSCWPSLRRRSVASTR